MIPARRSRAFAAICFFWASASTGMSAAQTHSIGFVIASASFMVAFIATALVRGPE